MPDQPSEQLLALIDQLGLASSQQVAAAGRRARRLARNLPLFDSVWVDALVQDRLLTPYQAAEINAGRGAQLAVDRYVISTVTSSLGYASCYAGQAGGEDEDFTLLVAPLRNVTREEAAQGLAMLVDRQQKVSARGVMTVADAGVLGDRVWAVSSGSLPLSAGDWMVRQGRLPGEAVLEIARQMAADLAALEAAGLLHGDLSATTLRLAPEGQTRLLMPGLRGLLRPNEGYAWTDLLPEAYNYLAPERIAEGSPPTTSSDLFACGSLWWHLLTGRPAIAGGNALAKIKAAHAGRIREIRHVAPDVPTPLAAAIDAVTQDDVRRRPSSFAELATTLGPPTRQGQAGLASWLAQQASARVQLASTTKAVRQSRHLPVLAAGLAGLLLMAAVVTYPRWSQTAAALWQTPSTAPEDEPGLAEEPTRIAQAVIEDAKPLASATRRVAATVTEEAQPARSAVTRAAATEPSRDVPDREPLILAGGQTVRAEQLELSPGLVVRAAAGHRATIDCTTESLRIAVDRVTFENIDFRVIASRASTADKSPHPAMVQCHARQATFRGCTWAAMANSKSRVTALQLAAEPLPSSEEQRLVLENCVLGSVTYGLRLRRADSAHLSLENVLYQGVGPLVRLDRLPAPEHAVLIDLTGCTLRGCSSLLDTRADESACGGITIAARHCVFALRPKGCLLRAAASAKPEGLAHAFTWQGNGSLLTQAAGFACWFDQTGARHPLDEASSRVDGLVRGEVKFAGENSGSPGSAAVTDWAAPIASEHAPGVEVALLPEPGKTR